MKIIKLSAENIKRLKAVEVTPSGDLVVIGGKNDAGKSSLLDAIEMAMSGEAATPSQPVRRGQKGGKIVLDLGDKIVTRTYTAEGGRKLVITNKDGARYPSPQALLDSLYGALSFDPLAFERQDRKEQADTLRNLVGLDTADLDAKRQIAYDARTDVNKQTKALEVQVDSLTRFDNAPTEEVSIAAIAAELDVAATARAEVARRAQVYQHDARAAQDARNDAQGIENEMTVLRKRLADLEAALKQADAEILRLSDIATTSALAASEAESKLPDEAAIRNRLTEAETINLQVQTNRRHAQAREALEESRAASRKLTNDIAALDAARADRLAAAAFPVDGLGIDDDGVTFNGLPFDQASTSDRIRVSVAIGLAMNPTLRVLLVRDGSLLGPDKVAILADMAKAAGAQVWLEMLQETPDARTSVFIEDGSVTK